VAVSLQYIPEVRAALECVGNIRVVLPDPSLQLRLDNDHHEILPHICECLSDSHLDLRHTGTAFPRVVEHHYGAPMRSFVRPQKLPRAVVNTGVTGRGDDEILSHVEGEAAATETATRMRAAEEAAQHFDHSTVGDEEGYATQAPFR